jgi:hypothetical protein
MSNIKDKTLVINLIGGPCAGKSTLRAGVFYELKKLGINCEEAPEYAKDKTYEQSLKVLDNQIYVFAKQHHRVLRLCGIVDVIVTDSPILLSIVYDASKDDLFKQFILQEYRKFNTMTYYVQRKYEYEQVGRNQTFDGALELDTEINRMLVDNNVPFKPVNGDEDGVRSVVEDVLRRIGFTTD